MSSISVTEASERASKQASRSKCRHCFLQRSSFFWVPLSCATRRQAPIPHCRLARWPLNTRFLFRCPRVALSPISTWESLGVLLFEFCFDCPNSPCLGLVDPAPQLSDSAPFFQINAKSTFRLHYIRVSPICTSGGCYRKKLPCSPNSPAV